MDDIRNFELFLLGLQLVLLVDQFLPQNAFLVVEVEEDGQVLGQFVVLLRFDDALDFPLLLDLLADDVDLGQGVFEGLGEELPLLVAVDLRLQVLLLPQLLLQQRLVVLVELASFPE